MTKQTESCAARVELSPKRVRKNAVRVHADLHDRVQYGEAFRLDNGFSPVLLADARSVFSRLLRDYAAGELSQSGVVETYGREEVRVTVHSNLWYRFKLSA